MSERNNEKRQLVPRLRFPEFRNAENWNSAQFDQLTSTITPPKKIPTSEYLSEGEFPIIDQGQDAIAGWTNDPDALIDADEPLIIFGDHTCALKLVQQPFAQGADGIKIIKGSEEVSTDYLYQFLSFHPVVTEEYKRHYSTLKTRWISYPDRESGEQKKISDCLSSLDELVAAETQRLGALKLYKKGLMHQLFPREGEAAPRLRFPEFRDMGEWEEKSLGDLGEVVTGNTPSTSKPEYYGGECLFVSPADISDLRYVETTKTLLSDLGFAQARQIEAGSILFVCIGSTIGKVAQNRFKCATNQQINSIIPHKDFFGDFIYYLLSRESQRIAKLAGIQAVPIINKSTFSAIRVRAPKPPEQMMIAELLCSLDNLISAQSEKISALNTHKNGVMQQLFPELKENMVTKHD